MEPTQNDENYKWGIFYYNKLDHRFIVPKRLQMMGWTFNFAHERVYTISILILIIIFSLSYLL